MVQQGTTQHQKVIICLNGLRLLKAQKIRCIKVEHFSSNSQFRKTIPFCLQELVFFHLLGIASSFSFYFLFFSTPRSSCWKWRVANILGSFFDENIPLQYQYTRGCMCWYFEERMEFFNDNFNSFAVYSYPYVCLQSRFVFPFLVK